MQVDRLLRRCGIGKGLMAALISLGTHTGMQKVMLTVQTCSCFRLGCVSDLSTHVYTANDSAMMFYTSIGSVVFKPRTYYLVDSVCS
jgi:GNAT superfamily N-acetyltransferase